MKGLGMFSGRVYHDDESRLNAKECCHVITDEQADDEAWIAKQHAIDIMECINCMGCDESRGGQACGSCAISWE